MNAHARLMLGVDGGGSKTCVWLGGLSSNQAASSELTVFGKAIGGPSNVRSLGFETALANVKETIADAFADAGFSPGTVARACISLAGAGRPAEQKRVVQWAQQQSIAEAIRVVGDAEVVLAAATPTDKSSDSLVGISLIAGTGSMAWGQNSAGEQVRCGGWGYLFGDEGSAYDIGRQALQLACQTADGRTQAVELRRRLLAHLRLDTSEQLIEWCYSSKDARGPIASLAPFVFSIASHDHYAEEILKRSTRALASLVKTVGGKLRFDPGTYRLACTGSVLVRQPDYCAAVLKELEELGIPPATHRLVQDPVAGALRLAALEAWPDD